MICHKSCSRCSGDQILESEWYGRYVYCLKCLHVTFPKSAPNLSFLPQALVQSVLYGASSKSDLQP